MAAESFSATVYENQEQFDARMAAPLTSEIEGDTSIERGYNLTGTNLVDVYEQAYPHVNESKSAQARVALDLRYAADLRTVVEVVTDQKTVQRVAEDYIDRLREKLPTGNIDLSGMDEVAKTGLIASILVEKAHDLVEPSNAEQLVAENVRLRDLTDQLQAIVTIDQMTAARELTEQAARIAELENLVARQQQALAGEQQKVADRDKIIFRKASETVQERFGRLRIIGGAAVSHVFRSA